MVLGSQRDRSVHLEESFERVTPPVRIATLERNRKIGDNRQ